MEQTRDGQPINRTKPFGATIVVYLLRAGEAKFLVLHRGHTGLDFEGEWAWGPPSGARYPGEEICCCAERELKEETGLHLNLRQTDAGSENWIVYLAQAPNDAEVRLSAEHDRFAWLPINEAAARIAPDAVRAQLVDA